jgi:hypothetical protein
MARLRGTRLRRSPRRRRFGPPEARALRPVRAYLRAADVPPPTVGAYGLVAFRAKPTSSTRARLLMVCSAFTASLPRQQDLAGVVPTTE